MNLMKLIDLDVNNFKKSQVEHISFLLKISVLIVSIILNKYYIMHNK